MEVDSQEPSNAAPEPRSTKKRSAPSDNEDGDDINERLLPAAAAMKKRRIGEEKQAQQRGLSSESSSGTTNKQPEAAPKKPKSRIEVNIQDAVRERREAEDEAARRDEETLTLDGADIESMRNLAVIEEMELPDRHPPVRRKDANGMGVVNERWDERWNGRKNFKKFRRSGGGEPRRRGPSVIVPLEEVKKKSQGIGEEYWLDGEKGKKKRREKEMEKERADQMNIDDEQPFTTAREVPQEAESVDEQEEVASDVTTPRMTRGSAATNQTHSRSQSQASGITRASTKGKRPAPAGANGGARKKQMILKPVDEGSDSEDDLKFRFKKRR